MHARKNHRGALSLLLLAGLFAAVAERCAFAQEPPVSAAAKAVIKTPAAEGATAVAPAEKSATEKASPEGVAKTPAGNDAALPTISIGAKPGPGGDVKRVKSLFFTQEEMARIRDAVTAYGKFMALHRNDAENEAKDFLNQLQDTKKHEVVEKLNEYPQFYLSYLVYHSPKDWLLRINGFKITPQDMRPAALKLRVVAVDSDKVLLEWAPSDMSYILDAWGRLQAAEGKKGVKKNAVKVDQKEGKVIFTLRPNQTFSSFAMRILEGKAKAVAFENLVAAPKPAMPESMVDVPIKPLEPVARPGGKMGVGQGMPGPRGSDKSKEESTQGLGGLINSYKRLGAVPP